MIGPDKDIKFPLEHYERLCFLKNVIKNPNIIVGDKLIIGRFCMIASDVKFIMNGANHLTKAWTAYPFSIFGKGWEHAMMERATQKKEISISVTMFGLAIMQL